MKIKLNERSIDAPAGSTLHAVRREHKPEADVLIVNGAPAVTDVALREGDAVVLIRRGEVPSSVELETLMMSRHTPGVHARVKMACVGIAGLGGLGSNIAASLARLGVGRLVIADFDVVEPSNLNRQNYFVEHIGMTKTTATAEVLERINPYLTVELHTVRLVPANVAQIFGSVDVLVEAFDTAAGKAMLVEAFGRAFPERPLVMASGLAGLFGSNSIKTRKFGANVYVIGDLVNEAAPGVGLMAPRVGIAASHQANAVLRLLMGEPAESE
jgi:sulfur carrier protein ThiS adenylyltransferase